MITEHSCSQFLPDAPSSPLHYSRINCTDRLWRQQINPSILLIRTSLPLFTPSSDWNKLVLTQNSFQQTQQHSFVCPLTLFFIVCCVFFLILCPLPSVIMTGAYNSFFRMFDRETGRGVTLEAWRESSKPRAVLRTRRVYTGGKRRRGDVGVDSLDFTKKILHMAWHPSENIIAIAATNNLYIFQDRVNPEAQAQQWGCEPWQQMFCWTDRKKHPRGFLMA